MKAINKATKDKSIKAIVLRVNSPGGDAIASELITNEVIKARKVKPVIVREKDNSDELFEKFNEAREEIEQ